MTSRIDQFKALLQQDATLELSEDKLHQAATLLAFSGAGLPLPVWTTREELEAAPYFTLIEDSDDAVYERWRDAWYCVRDAQPYTADDILLPVSVRWLPPELPA